MTVAIEIGAPMVDQTAPITSDRTGPCRILFAGRLIYWKGAEILADALLRLDRPGAGLEVTVIGTGARAAEVSAAFRKLEHIPAHVLGAVPQQQLFATYLEADLFVFPSLHDSSGNVVLEAMTFGLPVLCLDLGGPPLLVDEGGVKVPARGSDYEALLNDLAAEIRSLADDSEKRRRLSALALRRARSITWDAVVAQGYGPLMEACMT